MLFGLFYSPASIIIIIFYANLSFMPIPPLYANPWLVLAPLGSAIFLARP